MAWCFNALARLRQWCDANGVYLIADEIAAGLAAAVMLAAISLTQRPDGERRTLPWSVKGSPVVSSRCRRC